RRLPDIGAVAVEPLLEAGNLLALQRDRQFANADRSLWALSGEIWKAPRHRKVADSVHDLESDVLAGSLENLSRRSFAFPDHFLGSNVKRAAGHVEGARAAGAATV